jgi:F-type H+-transporting ATPase subunit epsilon
MRTLQLDIVAPEKLVFSGDVSSVQALGTEGWFEILPLHQPMLILLIMGPLIFIDACRISHKLFISGGFTTIHEDLVTVLVDSAETAEEIDIARASAARDRARYRLSSGDKIDSTRAEAALSRALWRLRVSGGV